MHNAYHHHLVIKINTNSTQIQHKFNTNNEIWPKLTNFLPKLSTQVEHKLNHIEIHSIITIIKLKKIIIIIYSYSSSSSSSSLLNKSSIL
jgi:hypothetical protein